MPKTLPPKGPLRLVILALFLLSQRPVPVQAQTSEPPHSIQWWEAGVAVGGVTALILVDQSVKDWAQDQRSQGTDDAADLLRHFGQPEVWAAVPAVIISAGLISGSEHTTAVGGRALGSALLAGAVEISLKAALGRRRPNEPDVGVWDFIPFSGNQSMPSGHTTVAFAFATSLADDLDPIWVKVGLYSLAAGTGWARINDNKHWFSDTVGGAIVGITSAKLVSGRWQVFGIRTPSIFVSDRGTTMSWHATF
jgi:membrane-associated phospholipid phosphatase